MIRDEFLRNLFAEALAQATSTPTETLNRGLDKQVAAIQKMREEAMAFEILFSKLQENNDCETMIAIIDKANELSEGWGVILHNTSVIHTMHVQSAPQHKEHREGKDYRFR